MTVAAFLIWLLALQRGVIQRLFGGRPIIRGLLEGILMLAMAFALIWLPDIALWLPNALE